MPRRSTVRYYPSRSAYYTQIDGVQHWLATGPDDGPDGPTYKAATSAFARLVCADAVDRSGDENPVEAVLTRFLYSFGQTAKPEHLHVTTKLVDDAIRAFGDVPVKTLRPSRVIDWLAKRSSSKQKNSAGKWEGWGESTCQTAWTRVKSAFAWAVRDGIITRNPLENAKCPYSTQARGEEHVLPTQLRCALIGAASPPFALALRVLEATGARPSEVFDAQGFNLSAGRLIYRWNAKRGYIWKNAAKTKKDRVIYLPPSVRGEVEQLAARYGDGPLFRGERTGKPWAETSRYKRFGELRDKPTVREWLVANGRAPETVIMYGFRHTYITDWLLAGLSIHSCARLCGTSVAIIERNYSHIAAQTDAMERLAVNFAALRDR